MVLPWVWWLDLTLQSSPAPTLLSTDPGANQISLRGSMHHTNAIILIPAQELPVE